MLVVFGTVTNLYCPDSEEGSFMQGSSAHCPIAYACIMTCIALRGLGWTLDDGAFDSEYGLGVLVLYQNIVKMFEEDLDDPWVRETLAWWAVKTPSVAAAKVTALQGNLKGGKSTESPS